MQWCADAVVVITGGWCVEKKKWNMHTEDTTRGENEKEKKKEKKRGAECRTREL